MKKKTSRANGRGRKGAIRDLTPKGDPKGGSLKDCLISGYAAPTAPVLKSQTEK